MKTMSMVLKLSDCAETLDEARQIIRELTEKRFPYFTMKYFSFLVCFHEKHVDIFLSGAPIGVIREGQFRLHQIITPSGNLRDTTMRDLQTLGAGGCPFATLDELKDQVNRAVAAMQMPSP